MIILEGLLRQSAEVTIKEKKRLKLVVEHETARDNGANDLHLETLFVDPDQAPKLPRAGSLIHVEVRPYPSGRGIAYAASQILREHSLTQPAEA